MQMYEEEIQEFLNAFDDFMKHAEMEEFRFGHRSEYDHYREESKMAIEIEIEQKAAELEITVDYYIAEFM